MIRAKSSLRSANSLGVATIVTWLATGFGPVLGLLNSCAPEACSGGATRACTGENACVGEQVCAEGSWQPCTCDAPGGGASASVTAATVAPASVAESVAATSTYDAASAATDDLQSSRAPDTSSTAATQGSDSTNAAEPADAQPPSDTCRSFTASQTSGFSLPIVYRDFVGADQGGHADFESFPESNILPGIVDTVLTKDGPRFIGQSGVGITSAASFASWFKDDTNFNIHINDTLNLTAGQEAFTYKTDRFFPIDEKAQVALDRETKRSNEECGGEADEEHNFSFTSELRLWFDYDGSEVLTFEGDDDVWIFVNNRLIVDLGGVHARVATDPPFAFTEDAVDTSKTALGLEVGRRYELAVFQAERRSCGSNYALTLERFKIVEPNCE